MLRWLDPLLGPLMLLEAEAGQMGKASREVERRCMVLAELRIDRPAGFRVAINRAVEEARGGDLGRRVQRRRVERGEEERECRHRGAL